MVIRCHNTAEKWVFLLPLENRKSGWVQWCGPWFAKTIRSAGSREPELALTPGRFVLLGSSTTLQMEPLPFFREGL
jgi:hypothetical protein